jgi:hypothetical protein
MSEIEIRYKFIADDQGVVNTFNTIEGAAKRSQQTVQRQRTEQKRQTTEQKATVRQQIQMMRQQMLNARMVQKHQEKQRQQTFKTARDITRNQIKEDQKLFREKARLEQQHRKRQERAETQAARQRRNSALRGLAGMAGQLALRGIAAVGVGAAALTGRALRDDIRLEDKAQGLAVRGTSLGERLISGRELKNQFRSIALQRPGVSTGDIISGAEAFVEKTGDLEQARRFAPVLAKVGLATGASQGDLGSVAADLQKKFGIDTASGMEQALSTLAVQGKRGQFELLDFAKQIPKIASAAERFGVKGGVGGVEQLGALAQIARNSTRSGSEAGTAVENLFRELTLKTDKIKTKTGVDVFSDKGRTQTRDIEQLIPEIIKGAKGNLTDLQQIFGTRGIRAVSSLIDKFNETRKGKLAGGASDEEALAAGAKAVADAFKEAKQATESKTEIERDAAAMAQTSQAKMTAAWESFSDAVSNHLTPVATDLITQFSKIVQETNAFESLADTFIALGEAASGAVEALEFLDLIKPKGPAQQLDALDKKQRRKESELASLTRRSEKDGISVDEARDISAKMKEIRGIEAEKDKIDPVRRLRGAGAGEKGYRTKDDILTKLLASGDLPADLGKEGLSQEGRARELMKKFEDPERMDPTKLPLGLGTPFAETRLTDEQRALLERHAINATADPEQKVDGETFKGAVDEAGSHIIDAHNEAGGLLVKAATAAANIISGAGRGSGGGRVDVGDGPPGGFGPKF